MSPDSQPERVAQNHVIGLFHDEHAEGAQRTTQEATQETAQETTRDKILAALHGDPTLTRNALAEHFGLSADGVKYHLGKLRAEGRIRHVGPTKAGRWEVLK
jgi:ATP-dependent DNA helicase RecG